MIALDEAVTLLEAEALPLGEEEIDAASSLGRVLATEVAADRDFPPTDRSAMDGFAVRAADVRGPGTVLRVAGEVRAGQAAGEAGLGPGEAWRIYTGAVLPGGADAVVMVERTREEVPGRVRIEAAVTRGDHVRRRGQDIERGAAVIEGGTPIRAAEIAALASVGRTRVRVTRVPRVAVLTTGDEVVEPDVAPLPHQIRNSNGPALIAQLAELGLAADALGIAGDDEERLDAALTRGLAADVLLVTGGVSVGEYDLVRAGLERAGMRVLFHGVSIKPGKPILAGRAGGCLVIGLPGNPVSTFVGFAFFVAPALRRMTGHRVWRSPLVRARLAERLRCHPGRTTLHLGRVGVVEGRLVAHPVRTTGSGDVLSLVRANALLKTGEADGDQEAGTELPALLWREFWLRG